MLRIIRYATSLTMTSITLGMPKNMDDNRRKPRNVFYVLARLTVFPKVMGTTNDGGQDSQKSRERKR